MNVEHPELRDLTEIRNELRDFRKEMAENFNAGVRRST